MPARLPLVRARDRRKIKAIFGTDIYGILSRVKLLRRCGNSCFFVPNTKILEDCQFSIIQDKQMNKYMRRKPFIPLCKKNTKLKISKRQRRERHRMKRRNRGNDAIIIPPELFDEFTESSDLEDSSPSDPPFDPAPKETLMKSAASPRRSMRGCGVRFGLSSKSPHFPTDHPLGTLDATGLFKSIMSDCPSAEPCLPLLKPYLSKFIINHKNFKYFHMIKNFASNSVGPFTSQLSEPQLNRLFSIIVFKVSPPGLFGHRGNVKRLRSGLLDHIKSRKRHFFIPDVITNRFNLKTITWLKGISDDKTKKLIINNLVEWFIKNYGMIVVSTYLASNRTADSSKRIFFPIMELRKQTDAYINNLLDRRVLVKTSYDKSNEIPIATLSLYLKPGGLRPIYQTFLNKGHKKMMKTLLTLMKQLNVHQPHSISPHDLHNVWKPYALGRKESRIFYVACDVSDAYGSINHEKLTSILDEVFEKLPDNIPYQTFYCMTARKHQYSIKIRFLHESLSLSMGQRSLFCVKPRGSGSVPKKLLRDKLQEFIDDQIVVINETCYKMRQGVGQGLRLSTLLSEIYYGRLMHEKFIMFQKVGTLVRYVDDFLYVTNHRVAAELFLFTVKNGIPDYNCKFNQSKTSTNLPPFCRNKFLFLGYKFDSLTGEVLPSGMEVPSQYNMTLRAVGAKEEQSHFKTRMMTFGGLKLIKLIYDPEINSRRTIIRALCCSCAVSARRCFIFCLHSINPASFPEEFIYKVIYEVINKMMRFYYTKVSRNKEENLAVRLTLWQIYVVVLKKNSMIAQRLLPLLKERVHILKKKFEVYTKANRVKNDVDGKVK